MRTFIAIKINPEQLLLNKIEELKKFLADEPLKWVDKQNLHVTLKFLGETSEEQSIQIKNILMNFAGKQYPVKVLPAGIGYFKSRGMPKVLFVDLKNGEVLQPVANCIDELLLPLGFEKENRLFKPHLTIARIKFLKNKKAFYEAVRHFQAISLPPASISEIIFYQSFLKPEGPVYFELGKYSFTAP
jgi:RNA 2',3'-cyclic 3'-phosphodiesterase